MYLVFIIFLSFMLVSCKKQEVYSITWQNDDGSILKIDENISIGSTPFYTGAEPTKEDTLEYSYTFIGWSPEITIVSESKTYTAVFSAHKKSYLVIFKNDDNAVLREQFVEYGLSATPPSNPTKEGFTFIGWDKDYQSIKSNLVIYALYTENLLTVTWQNDDGSILKIDENISVGSTPFYTGAEPTKEDTLEYSYTFIGWTPTITSINQSTTYTASYHATKKSYSVIFKDYDDLVLMETTVIYGTNVLPPLEPNRKIGYHFVAWDQDYSFITKDIIIYAQYQINTYVITWVNDDGTILKIKNIEYLSIPEYDVVVPTKENNDSFAYEFIGFSPKIVAATKNSTYIAQYKPKYVYPEYYVLASDEDFSGDRDGYFIYTGNLEYIIIPEYIKGVKVTKFFGNKFDRLFYTNPFVKGVAFENPLNIIDTSYLFYKHQSETLELNYLYTPNVINMESMFEDCEALNINANLLDTANVTTMKKMFKHSKASTINFLNFNTQKVTNFSEMFHGASVEHLDLSSFDTSSAYTLAEMFRSARALSINLSSFNTANVTDMDLLFYGSRALSLDLSSFNTSKITNMKDMFAYCEAIEINLSSFDTSKVTNMSYMFSHSHAQSLDLSSFDTSKVNNMDRMFYWSKAKSIYLLSFNTANVTNMSSMFEVSSALVLDLSSFNFDKLLFASSMFKNCAATLGYVSTQELADRFNNQKNIFVVKAPIN